jgi:hypothetical protein
MPTRQPANRLRLSLAHNNVSNTNILNTLVLNRDEWCELHWKRIKNSFFTGISTDEIERIYDNIIFIRKNNCASIYDYRRYLEKKDSHSEIKKKVEILLISGIISSPRFTV